MDYSYEDNQPGDSRGISLRLGPNENVTLTPEEMKILRTCGQEGIRTKAIPLGILFSMGSYMGIKMGFFKASKFGTAPVVIGFGAIGYFLGRFQHSKICLDRLLQVPDGNFKKYFMQKQGLRYANTDFNAQVETSQAPRNQEQWDLPAPSSDIDVAGMSNFDTTPPEYYNKNIETLPEQQPTQNYTSYDDLRKQNREEYASRYQPRKPFPQRTPAESPQSKIVKKSESDESQPISFGTQRTKYGDVWE